ncbi:MAG: glycerol-3-phosphate 1-O-acyltransferase PlsY [bacterium]
MKLSIIFILSYMIGAIPFSLLIGLIFGRIDIRKVGSKNIGSTNLSRAMGLKWGIVGFFLDVLKGALPVLFIPYIFKIPGSLSGVICGTGAIIGHMLPVYLGFKGGKGVATALGVVVALITIPALICFGVFIIVVFITRYVSVGSMIASTLLPISYVILNNIIVRKIELPILILSIIIAFGVLITHRENIKRLIKGTENRFGEKTKEKQD